MKKRTLGIIIIIVLVIASLWLARQDTAPLSDAESQETNALVLLDDQQNEESATNETDALDATDETATEPQAASDEFGSYTTKEDVGLYLATYGRLPDNFITKTDARALGWSGGGLDDYSYGKCIGGDRFGNNEGLLPDAAGRTYYECDIDTLHEDDRGAKRIVYSNDGLIYYTDDHYESFDLLYGEP